MIFKNITFHFLNSEVTLICVGMFLQEESGNSVIFLDTFLNSYLLFISYSITALHIKEYPMKRSKTYFFKKS